MNNKRGLSDVITTVLIILLVLASIVLIWGFIRTQLQTGGNQIEASSGCFQLQLTPTSCVIVKNATSANDYNVTASVKWAAGDVDLKSMKFIVADDKGSNNYTILTNTFNLYSTPVATVSVKNLDIASGTFTLTASGVISTKSGNNECPESYDSVVCK